MSDQCKHCTMRGDITEYLATECFQHESWYAIQQQATIATLTEQVRVLELLDANESCLDIYMNFHVSEISKQTRCVMDAWECGQRLYALKLNKTPPPKEAE